MDFYVYLHKKKTTGDVFYVGKGSGNRAWDKYGRNVLWKRTVEKHGYTVEIVLHSLQEWYAFELERDLIAAFGKVSARAGTLVNMTDGGDGYANGEANFNYDSRIWTFLNVDTQEEIRCTKHEFKRKHKDVSIDNMRRCVSSKRWVITELFQPQRIKAMACRFKGEFHRNADERVYTVINLLNNEHLTGTRYYLAEHIPGLNIKNLNSGYTLTSQGWTFQKNIDDFGVDYLINQNKGNNNYRTDTEVYKLFNLLTEETFEGTRNDFKEAFGFSLGDIFVDGNLSVKNWCLYQNIAKAKKLSNKDFTVFTLENIDGRRFIGTKFQFKHQHKDNISPLFLRNNPPKSALGWCIVS